MSISTVLLDGARRAAAYATMLFSLNSPLPAAAPPPAAPPEAGAPAIDGSLADAGLTLVAHHLEVRIADGVASVQSSMLLRNDRPTEAPVQYVLPRPARVVRGDGAGLGGPGDTAAPCDETDLSPQAAEQAEAASKMLVHRYDVIVFAPGEQVSVEVQSEWPVQVAGGVHRLSLPLPVDREAPWVPRFTADVFIDAGQPIRRLRSPTHHRALIDGLGETSALLSVPDGFVYRQPRLAVEFELGQPENSRPIAALDRSPVGRNR